MKVLDVSLLMRGPHSSDSVFVWRVALLLARQMLAPCLVALLGWRVSTQPERCAAWSFISMSRYQPFKVPSRSKIKLVS